MRMEKKSMNSQKYEPRTIWHRLIRRIRLSKKQKLNTVLVISVAAAVMLVVVLSIAKLYTVLSGNGSDTQKPKVVKEVPPTVETPAAEETMATPTSPRPKAVALTFDDGPSRANDSQIVKTLEKYNAHATFFVLGDRARVDGDIMQMYVAAGCEIGSHSWNHPQLSKLKWDRVERQLNRTNKIVSKLVDGYEIKLLRPPYGSISKKMRKKLDMPMILWSLDTMDWKSRNSTKIFKKVKKKVKDGDIILMHNIYGSTAEAVEKIVPWLQDQGYDVLTVTELMERNGKKIENGKAYLHGKN